MNRPDPNTAPSGGSPRPPGPGVVTSAPAAGDGPTGFHTRAWLLWLLAALTPALSTKNPWYLTITLVAVGLTFLRLARGTPAFAGWGALLRLGLALAVFATLFPPLFVKAGETTLWTLPALRLELPLGGDSPPVLEIGGRISLESVVYGLATGLALVVILVTFATFTSAADPYQMLRSIPRFLHRSAVVLSIAISFVPQLVTAQREIREAQALRGHRFRGLRDLVPLFVTLLSEGLERSITLAEALEARGFGGMAEGGSRPGLAVRGALVGALALMLGGALLRGWSTEGRWGDGLLALGLLTLVAALWAVGRQVHRSRYRREVWRPHDTLVAAASLAALGLIAVFWTMRRGGLAFYPYPRLTMPGFDPWIALALCLLATPAVVALRRTDPTGVGSEGGGP